jgi:outer membrane protein assembly factor BamB
LADLFRREKDPLVKAAAAEAIGRIGVDPEGIALRAFEEIIFPALPRREEALLTAIASSIGSLCRFSGPPLSDAGIRLLTILAANDTSNISRRQAQIEIRSLTN